jgi:hypothetical protein
MSEIHDAGDEADHAHSRSDETARVPLPPLAGKMAGFGVAATAHRAGEGATLVLEEVDPHAADAMAAMIRGSAKRIIREWSASHRAHERAGIRRLPGPGREQPEPGVRL